MRILWAVKGAFAWAIVGTALPAFASEVPPPSPATEPPALCAPAIVLEALPVEARAILGARTPTRRRPQRVENARNLFDELRVRSVHAVGNRIGTLLAPEKPEVDPQHRGAGDTRVLLPSAPTFIDPTTTGDRGTRPSSAQGRAPPRPVVAEPQERRMTQNGMGWESLNWDPIAEGFARLPLQRTGPTLLLDVGCGYGRIARAAAANGGTIVCNDLDARHLLALAEEAEPEFRSRFMLHVGNFLVNFPWRFAAFDAILVSRMAHFLSPKQFMKMLRQCRRLLVNGGHLYLTTGGPRTRSFRAFRPEFERRKRAGDLWPGYIDGRTHKVSEYFPEARGRLPESMNLFDPEIMDRALGDAQFQITQAADWMAHPDSPPEHAEDGQELVGGIYTK